MGNKKKGIIIEGDDQDKEEFLSDYLSKGIKAAKYDLEQKKKERFVFSRSGEIWIIGYNGVPQSFKHREGFRVVQFLLKNPNKTFDIQYLEVELFGNSPDYSESIEENEEGEEDYGDHLTNRSTPEGRDGIIDKKTQAKVLGRLKEVIAGLERNPKDQALIELHAEILRYLSRVTFRGRIKQWSNYREKMRKNYWKYISDVKKALKSRLPDLITHFSQSIETGESLAYKPDKKIDWKL